MKAIPLPLTVFKVGQAPTNLQDFVQVKQFCERVDFTIYGWPIVLNPSLRDSIAIALEPHLPNGEINLMNLTGTTEVQISPSYYSALALPDRRGKLRGYVLSILRDNDLPVHRHPTDL